MASHLPASVSTESGHPSVRLRTHRATSAVATEATNQLPESQGRQSLHPHNQGLRVLPRIGQTRTEPQLFDMLFKGVPHKDHEHFGLVAPQKVHSWKDIEERLGVKLPPNLTELLVELLDQGEEGCPCCLAGIDLDELCAAIKFFILRNHEHGWANFASPEFWVIAAVTSFFITMGLTAASRNILDSRMPREKLLKLQKALNSSRKGLAESTPSAGSNEEFVYKDLDKALEALEDTVGFSLKDNMANTAGPGMLNGVASTVVGGIPDLSSHVGCLTSGHLCKFYGGTHNGVGRTINMVQYHTRRV